MFSSRKSAAPSGGYNLTKSLRFRASASAYLNRTFGTPTDTKKFTWSGWVKRGTLGAFQVLQCGDDGTSDNFLSFRFSDTDTLQCFQIGGGSYNLQVSTSAVFRDPSAWYHIVFIYDSANATSTNRIQFYVNGVLQTVSYAVGPFTINTASQLNVASRPNAIGRLLYASVNYFDGYLAEVNFIDGQALTPSSFGETSTTTGVWIPKKYTGTYGTNGFYLPFTDTTSTSTLGTDFSGNSNTWTVNNISLTAGSTYDSMTDVPTLTSATTANYCVINPLANSGIGTLSRGNLQLVTSTNSKTITGTLALPSTGQYYWEITATDYITDNGTFFGVVNQSFLTGAPSNGTWLGFNTYSATYNNGTSTDTNGLTGTNVTNDGDIWCIAVDVTNNKFWIGRSRAGSLTWADGTTPAVNGSGATTLSLPSNTLYPMAYRGGSDNETYNFNFGQQPFAHTPPTGFVALNTFNISAGTITTSGSFTGNTATDGPFIYLNGVPTAMTINGNSVTFGTDADKLSNGFKVRSSSSSYNASGSNTYSISTTSDKFKFANAQPNP